MILLILIEEKFIYYIKEIIYFLKIAAVYKIITIIK